MKKIILLIVFCLCIFAFFFQKKNQESKIRMLGEKSAGALLKTLLPQVKKAVQEGGFIHAIDFCSKKAEILTMEVEKKSLKSGISIKRISNKNRNPKNAPDLIDLKALEFFTAHQSEANRPSFFIKEEQIKTKRYFRYYKPLYIKGLCLVCHGTNIPNNLHKAIRLKYPNDKAIGYKDGDFRGVVRVKILEEALKDN